MEIKGIKMKKIKLTQGKFALVDDDDFEYLNQFKWQAKRAQRKVELWYATRSQATGYYKRIEIKMHREIMKAPKGMDVDHISGDGLDNRKDNLRICNRKDNSKNKCKFIGTSSKYKGVSALMSNAGYIQITAKIMCDSKPYYLGTFKTEREAALSYDRKAIELFGEFARTNKMLRLL